MPNNMVIAIVGATCSGKTTLAEQLEAISGWPRLIPWTTRPMRKDEIAGVNYHFVSDEEFDLYLNEEDITYPHAFLHYFSEDDEEPGTVRYGLPLPDLKVVSNKILPTDYDTVRWLRANNYDVYVIRLNIAPRVIMDRGITRGDSQRELERRIASDTNDFLKYRDEGNPIHLEIVFAEDIEQQAKHVYGFLKRMPWAEYLEVEDAGTGDAISGA